MILEIIICTYNRAADLDRCLSALARQEQANGDWRVTVIDNNCSDSTAEVVETHVREARVPGLRRIVEPRQGLTPARQSGVSRSQATWIAFVDDDCVVACDWVASAIRFGTFVPDAGGFGGKVRPVWGRSPPAYLTRHAWLFAAQDHGDRAHPVESLVGASVVLNRRALHEVGWAANPYLADRTGLGHVSGGDVEICFRLKTSGWPLWYAPALQIDHRIAPARQKMRSLLALARGLGAGAELVSLMGSQDPEAWMSRVRPALKAETRHHLATVSYVVRGQYPWQDWLIRTAFLLGQRKQHGVLSANSALRTQLGGVWSNST